MDKRYTPHPFSIESLTSNDRHHTLSTPSVKVLPVSRLDISPSESTGSRSCTPENCTSISGDFNDTNPISPASTDSGHGGSPPTLAAFKRFQYEENLKKDNGNDSETDSKKSPADPNGKPAHSYIALISLAILSCPEKKMILSDIYQYVMDNFAFYNNEERAWRNSIRHNLSLNECFIKAGRADNGKGNFWAIHPACVEDFAKGDFRRRQARRRARGGYGEMGVTALPFEYRNNFGYVPMSSSPALGYGSYLHPQMAQFYQYQQASMNMAAGLGHMGHMPTPTLPMGMPTMPATPPHGHFPGFSSQLPALHPIPMMPHSPMPVPHFATRESMSNPVTPNRSTEPATMLQSNNIHPAFLPSAAQISPKSSSMKMPSSVRPSSASIRYSPYMSQMSHSWNGHH